MPHRMFLRLLIAQFILGGLGFSPVGFNPKGKWLTGRVQWASPGDLDGRTTKLGDLEVLGGQFEGRQASPPVSAVADIPPPLNLLVDVNLERRTVIYEAVLGRDVGFEVVQGNGAAVVGKVSEHHLFFICPTKRSVNQTPAKHCECYFGLIDGSRKNLHPSPLSILITQNR